MNPEMRVLRVTSFGENEKETAQITLNPAMIQMVAAFDDMKKGRPVKRAVVMFVDGGNVELYVSEYDLMTIEQAVGAYALAFD